MALTWRRPLGSTPMGRSAGRSSSAAGRSVPGGDHRWRVTGGGQPHLLAGGLHDRAQDGGHHIRLELTHMPVETVQQLGGIGRVEGVGAQRVPQPPHLHRGGQPPAGDVADHDAQRPGRQREHVVPVPADLPAAAGTYRAANSKPATVGSCGGQQAALQRVRRGPLDLGGAGMHGQRDPVGHELEQIGVVGGETRGRSVPTCRTPSTAPPTNSGTPSSEWIPLSRRIGLSTLV